MNPRSVNRQCINFDKLMEWRKENTVDTDYYLEVMQMSSGVRGAPISDAHWSFHHDALKITRPVHKANQWDELRIVMMDIAEKLWLLVHSLLGMPRANVSPSLSGPRFS